MAAIPVTSDETFSNPRIPLKADDLDDQERRLTILERNQGLAQAVADLETRVQAIETFLGI